MKQVRIQVIKYLPENQKKFLKYRGFGINDLKPFRLQETSEMCSFQKKFNNATEKMGRE